jgi:two-component system, OmpR family, phosphate regulon sensor histidine kinase PhoR|tara:strand:+ start:2331 stop:3944 length:1614 start_codon:yes stop_codon:yes gene_type:complete
LKNNFIKLLIVAMAMVLVGLISIQFYWVNNAVQLTKDAFSRDVYDGLHDVVSVLEKDEALRKIRSHRQGRMLFFDTDSVNIKDLSSVEEEISITKQVERIGEKIVIDYVEKSDDMQKEEHISIDIEELLKGDNTGIDLKFEKRQGEKSYVISDLKIDLDTIMKNRLFNKTILVSDIVKSLMEVNLNEKIVDRIDSKQVQEMLTQTLERKGISTVFEFGVFNSNAELVLTNNPNGEYEFFQTEYSARLFPDDIIQEVNYLNVHFPNQTGAILKSVGGLLTLSAILVLALTLIFYYAITIIVRQKKLSEIRNDFINNMTHELKTPISTISLACEALSDPNISKSEKLFSRYIGLIKEENSRLGSQVENVLQSAVWGSEVFKLKHQPLDLNAIVAEVTRKIEFQVTEKGGSVSVNIDTAIPVFYGDQVHITNVLFNLLDNANKYSRLEPKIKVTTRLINNHIEIKIKDNGIGINKENQKKIFDKLYRVPTGNRHDVKGFGLGLNYVKTIIEKHGGKIQVQSAIGKGSTFIIQLMEKQKSE